MSEVTLYTESRVACTLNQECNPLPGSGAGDTSGGPSRTLLTIFSNSFQTSPPPRRELASSHLENSVGAVCLHSPARLLPSKPVDLGAQLLTERQLPGGFLLLGLRSPI